MPITAIEFKDRADAVCDLPAHTSMLLDYIKDGVEMCRTSEKWNHHRFRCCALRGKSFPSARYAIRVWEAYIFPDDTACTGASTVTAEPVTLPVEVCSYDPKR